jgi:hypothetical protein
MTLLSRSPKDECGGILKSRAFKNLITRTMSHTVLFNMIQTQPLPKIFRWWIGPPGSIQFQPSPVTAKVYVLFSASTVASSHISSLYRLKQCPSLLFCCSPSQSPRFGLQKILADLLVRHVDSFTLFSTHFLSVTRW